jgi:hypothetical protein
MIVFGKEFEIPNMPEEGVKANLLSILREIDPDTANELEKTKYSVRVEGNVLVIYRLSAIFG